MDRTHEEPERAGTVEVTMPDTGSAQPTAIVAWLKRPGEQVTDGDPICLVAWGEQRAEIASPAAGVLRMIALGIGTAVPTGATLAVIDIGLRGGYAAARRLEMTAAERELAGAPA